MVTHTKLLLCEPGRNQLYFVLREQGIALKLQEQLHKEAHMAAQSKMRYAFRSDRCTCMHA